MTRLYLLTLLALCLLELVVMRHLVRLVTPAQVAATICEWCGAPVDLDEGIYTDTTYGSGDYCPEGLDVGPTGTSPHKPQVATKRGVVLDPFAGSGSTLLAAEMEGFEWLGIEKEREYCDIAEARLNGTQRGLGLDSPAPTPRPARVALENTTAKRAAYGRKPHEGSTWRLHGHPPIDVTPEESAPVDSVDLQLFAGMAGPAEGDEVA